MIRFNPCCFSSGIDKVVTRDLSILKKSKRADTFWQSGFFVDWSSIDLESGFASIKSLTIAKKISFIIMFQGTCSMLMFGD